MGKRKSAEHCANIGRASKGRVFSDEARAKMSARRVGKPSPTKGKTLSEQARLNISKSKMGMPSPNKGKVLSSETRAKLSAAAKAAHQRRTNQTPNCGIVESIVSMQ